MRKWHIDFYVTEEDVEQYGVEQAIVMRCTKAAVDIGELIKWDLMRDALEAEEHKWLKGAADGSNVPDND